MYKFPLSGRVMSSVAYVERAAFWSRELTRMRTRGSGDIENAMRAIERDYGIEYGIIWRLRYRLAWLKDISVGVYARIEAAYIAECERQQRKLDQQLENARQISAATAALAATASRLGRAAEETPVQQRVGEKNQ